MPRRRLLCLLLVLPLVPAFGADTVTLEINSAERADLESLPGLGPQLTERILAARAQAPLRDWADLMHRVPGIKAKLARRLSAQGLRIDGRAFSEP